MAIVVEDGTGLAAANSYVSTTEVDSYFSARRDLTQANSPEGAWALSTASTKEAALIKATEFIDSHWLNRFRGLRLKPTTQALQWPRWAFDDEGYQLTGVPKVLRWATAEAAVRVVLGMTLQPDLDRGGAVQSVTIGPITMNYALGASSLTVFTLIEELLQGLLVPGGGRGALRVTRT